jgi:hypothetical protein
MQEVVTRSMVRRGSTVRVRQRLRRSAYDRNGNSEVYVMNANGKGNGT